MEVIFDSNNLKPRLSPGMRTTLSVITLIANSLVEANKCMKERLAEEAGGPMTLDQVMQQSGLNIPGLEETLAQLMGGGADAKQAASMIVKNPDPATLLRMFTAQQGFAPASPERPAPGPIVTPPPTVSSSPVVSAAPAAAPATTGAPGPRLAPFRADFTREGREAAKQAGATSSPHTLPQFRQDFTPEGRRAAQVQSPAPAPGSARAASPECMTLLGSLARQLEAIRGRRVSFEAMVQERLVALEAELARLREEFNRLYAALVSKAQAQSEEAAAAAADGGDAATASGEAVDPGASEAGVAADEASEPDSVDPEHGANELAADEPGTPPAEPLPPAASPEEVAQAIDMVTTFAGETQAAEAQQVARITAVEQEVARMRALVESAGAALGGAGAHA